MNENAVTVDTMLERNGTLCRVARVRMGDDGREVQLEYWTPITAGPCRDWYAVSYLDSQGWRIVEGNPQ